MKNSNNENINNIILALSNEHEYILQQIEIISNGLKKLDNEDFIKWLISIENTFINSLKRHFMIEEKIIFPAALEAIPTSVIINIVSLLIKEHGILEEKLECLFNFAKSNKKKEDECYFLLRNSLNNILEINKNHAKIEVIELYPKVATNTKACSLIDLYYSKYVSKL